MSKKDKIKELLYKEQFKEQEQEQAENDDFSRSEFMEWMQAMVDNILN